MIEGEAQLIEAVRALAPSFAERAPQHDREGSFPAENIADLQALGVPGMTVPAQHGGRGASAEARIRIIEAIAYGDASTAVALNMHWLMLDALQLAPIPSSARVLEDAVKNQALVCGPGSVVSSGLDTRAGTYRAKDDGDTLVVTGKQGFASMSEGATYVFLAGQVERGSGTEPDFFFAAPRIDTPGIRNLRNWDAMGMRGTASHDIACEDLRLPKGEVLVVPRSFMAMFTEMAKALPAEPRQARAASLAGILGIWLGVSRAALDQTTAYAKARYGAIALALPGLPDPGLRSEEPWAQVRLGEMAAQVETGRIVLYHLVERLGTPFPSIEDFTNALLHTTYVLRRMTEEVAMGAMKVCGAHAYVRSHPLERLHRDLMGCVVMAWKTDDLVLQLGRAALGLPTVFAGPVGA